MVPNGKFISSVNQINRLIYWFPGLRTETLATPMSGLQTSVRCIILYEIVKILKTYVLLYICGCEYTILVGSV